MKKTTLRLISHVAAPWLGSALLILVTIAYLSFQLNSLVPGFAIEESLARSSARLFTPVDLIAGGFLPYQAPFTILVRVFDSLRPIRLTALLFGVAALFFFFWSVRKNYSRRAAFLGTILLATCPWFLHLSRYASTDAIYLLTFCVPIIGSIALTLKQFNAQKFVAATTLAGAVSYVPGMMPLVIASLVWKRKKIAKRLRLLPGRWRTITIAMAGTWFASHMLILCFAIAQGKPLSLLRSYGLPDKIPTPVSVWNTFAAIPTTLFGSGATDITKGLPGTPYLNVIFLVFFMLGLFTLANQRRRTKSILLAIWLVVTLVLCGLGGVAIASLLAPIMYISVAGMALFLQQWSTVFPRNPFAKTFAFGLLTVIVAGSALYGLKSYFIAWPQTVEVHQVFTIR